MYGKFLNAFSAVNMMIQSVFTLLTPVGLLVLLAWFLRGRAGLGEWVYVPAVLLGLAIGFYSMIRYLLAALKSQERMEKERTQTGREKADKEGRRHGNAQDRKKSDGRDF